MNVVIEALTQGAATDVDGSYTIEDVPEGTHEVSARFVGYGDDQATVDVQAGETTTQNFALGEDLLMLDELVVTGTGGSVERRKLSADVSVLNIRDIEEAPVTSVDQLLQGRVAGASVRMQSAQPGQGALVNLRGITSVFGSQTPVIYIDGVRVDNASGTSLSGGGETTSALAELLTNDVERVEITKGGAASTLYGSDAANGVIQIFTKRGNIGDPTITFRTEQGLDTPVTKFLNDTGFAFGQDEDSPVNDPESDDFGQGNFIADEFLKNGYFQNYYVGVNGGREGLRYNVSGRAQNTTGVQPSNEKHPLRLARERSGRGNAQPRRRLQRLVYAEQLLPDLQRHLHRRPDHELRGGRRLLLHRGLDVRGGAGGFSLPRNHRGRQPLHLLHLRRVPSLRRLPVQADGGDRQPRQRAAPFPARRGRPHHRER